MEDQNDLKPGEKVVDLGALCRSVTIVVSLIVTPILLVQFEVTSGGQLVGGIFFGALGACISFRLVPGVVVKSAQATAIVVRHGRGSLLRVSLAGMQAGIMTAVSLGIIAIFAVTAILAVSPSAISVSQLAIYSMFPGALIGALIGIAASLL